MFVHSYDCLNYTQKDKFLEKIIFLAKTGDINVDCWQNLLYNIRSITMRKIKKYGKKHLGGKP